MDRNRESTRDSDQGGFALVLVIFVMVVMAALIAASVTLGSNHLLVNKYHQRSDQLTSVSDAGLEKARSMLNGDDSLYPDAGYTTLESNLDATDANGDPIPGVKRSLYVGPIGITSGQYGTFGVIVSVAEDGGGGVQVNRLVVSQESFAQFAYFTDVEPSNISFGGGDQIFGPVHTNDRLKIYSSGATFHKKAVTGKDVYGEQYGTFKEGYEEYGTIIPMPKVADLNKLKAQATAGGTAIIGTNTSNQGEATTRIEFVAIDLNGDLDTNDENEGFFKVYKSNDRNWVSGDVPDWSQADNCGDFHAGNVFVSTDDHPSGGHNWRTALQSATRACFLGGSDVLNPGGAFMPVGDGCGIWEAYGGAVSPLLVGRPDAQYLFPISRSMNPSFKGVIYVDGDVVVSGTVRGQVTLAATGEISVADDLTYVSDPGLGTCEDLVGLFAGEDVVVSYNALNAPWRPTGNGIWYTFDDTSDEFIHGVMLTLDNFTVESYAAGATRAEPCGAKQWGRGCLFLAGGIIQKQRGAVGTIWWVGGTGYVKRYSYDGCASTQPPPYFPTTGHFVKSQHFQMDPTGFNIDNYFAEIQNP